MELNQVVAEIAIRELNKFNSDSSLFDSIVECDSKTVRHLINGKYKLMIINHGFIKEPISITKMIQAIEIGLNRNKHIRLING